jgi:hypothetical protein
MKGPEAIAWRRFRERLAGKLILRRVENAVGSGDPDVWFGTLNNHYSVPVSGWIELKRVKDWPKRDETPLIIDTFSPAQRLVLRRLTNNGHRAFLLCFIGRGCFIMDGKTAATELALRRKYHPDTPGATKEDIQRLSLGFWDTFTCWDTLLAIIVGLVEEQPIEDRMAGGSVLKWLGPKELPPWYADLLPKKEGK